MTVASSLESSLHNNANLLFRTVYASYGFIEQNVQDNAKMPALVLKCNSGGPFPLMTLEQDPTLRPLKTIMSLLNHVSCVR